MNVYTGANHAKLGMIISDIGHDIQPEEVKETIDFYTSRIYITSDKH